MTFLAWACKFETANFHMNFSVWKCRISIEFACLEVHSFIWIFEIPWLEGLHFTNFPAWKYPISDKQMKLPNFIWSSLLGSAKFHEFLCLEVPNFKWISLIGSAKFHLKLPAFIWISLFGSAKFQLNLPAWKFIVLYEHLQFPDLKG